MVIQDSNTQEQNFPVQRKALKSAIVRAGKKTYFFDVFSASNSKKYLKITESQLAEEGQPNKRTTFVLFPEVATDFQSRLNEIVSSLVA